MGIGRQGRRALAGIFGGPAALGASWKKTGKAPSGSEARQGRKMRRLERHKALAEAAFGELPESPQFDVGGLQDYYGDVGDPMQYAGDAYDFMDVPGVNEAERAAVMGELNRGALQESVGRRQALQAGGGYGGAQSGTGLALQMAGLTNLGFNRAQAEAGLQSEAAARQMQARQTALGFGTDRYGQEINLAGLRGGQDFQRAQAGFEANQLLPWQTQIARQQQIAQAALGRRAANMQMVSGIVGGALGTAGQVGGAYIGRGG